MVSKDLLLALGAFRGASLSFRLFAPFATTGSNDDAYEHSWP